MVEPGQASVNPVVTRLSGEYKMRMAFLFGLMLFLSLPIAMAARRNGSRLFWAAAIAPVGLLALILAPDYRRSPRVLDAAGVERRDGKRLSWDDFLEQRTVMVTRAGNTTGPSHTELRFRGGVVRIFPLMFDDLEGIFRFLGQREAAAARTAATAPPPAPAPVEPPTPPARPAGPCPACGPLGTCRRGMQTHGREAEDTFLPPETAQLRRIKDVRPGKTRTPELLQCPTCQDYFLFEITYEYLATGSEDEQILTRLDAATAQRYVDGWDGRSA